MAEKKVRGLTKEQELNEEFLVRDTRGKLKKFKDWITIPNNMFVLLFMMAAAAILKNFFLSSSRPLQSGHL